MVTVTPLYPRHPHPPQSPPSSSPPISVALPPPSPSSLYPPVSSSSATSVPAAVAAPETLDGDSPLQRPSEAEVRAEAEGSQDRLGSSRRLKAAVALACVLCLVSVALLGAALGSASTYSYSLSSTYTYGTQVGTWIQSGGVGPFRYSTCNQRCLPPAPCSLSCAKSQPGSGWSDITPRWKATVGFIIASLVVVTLCAALMIARAVRWTLPHAPGPYSPTWDRALLALLSINTVCQLIATLLVATFDVRSNLAEASYMTVNSVSLSSGFTLLLVALVFSAVVLVLHCVVYRLGVLRRMYLAAGTTQAPVEDREPAGWWASHAFNRLFYAAYGIFPSVAAFAVLVDTLNSSTALFSATLNSDTALSAGTFSYVRCYYGQCQQSNGSAWDEDAGAWVALQAFLVLSTVFSGVSMVCLTMRFVWLLVGRYRRASYSQRWDRRLLVLLIASLLIQIIALALYRTLDLTTLSFSGSDRVSSYRLGQSSGMVLFAALWSIAVVAWYALALWFGVCRGIVCPHPAWAKGWASPTQAVSHATTTVIQQQIVQIVLHAPSLGLPGADGAADMTVLQAQLAAIQAAFPQANVVVTNVSTPPVIAAVTGMPAPSAPLADQ